MTLNVDRICRIDRQDAWYKSLGRVVRELKERKKNADLGLLLS